MPHSATQHATQSGAALVIALVFLVAITLLGLTSIRSSTMELRMAINEETRITAMEQAQAMIDLVESDDNHLLVTLDAANEVVSCYPAGADCAAPKLMTLITTEFDGEVYAEVRRLEPARVPMTRGGGNSGDKLYGALFGIVGGYDRSDEGLGAAEIEQGKIKTVSWQRGVNN